MGHSRFDSLNGKALGVMTPAIEGSSPSRGAKIKCSCGENNLYGIVKENKLRRLTFSLDLAKYIQKKNLDHEIFLLDIFIGKIMLTPQNCIFGIATQKNPNRLLRATISWDEAMYLTEKSNRVIVECYVREAKKYGN